MPIIEELKPIYQANSLDKAEERLKDFRAQWQKKTPEDCERLQGKLLRPDYHLKLSVRPIIYTTNTTERAMKEVKNAQRV